MKSLSDRKIGAKVGCSLAALALVMTALLSSSAAASSTTAKKASANTSYLNIMGSADGPFADGFNPYSLSNAAYGAGVTAMIYEPLFQYNLLKVGQIYPWLATSWAWENNGKELVLHTRRGVKWSDGTPFSAADVAFTFNLMTKYPALNGNGVTFVSASAPSTNEAIIKFASPAYTQLFDISQVLIVPEHIWKSISNPVIYVDDNPVGTGPYIFSSFSVQEFTLVRNPNYWQKGLPKIQTLHFLTASSTGSAGLTIESGTIDWNTIGIPNWKNGFVDKDPTQHFESISSIGNWFMCPNLTEYPYNQVAVRKAISLALDRPAISNEGEHGFYPATVSQTGLTLPRWQPWLAPQYSKAILAYNPGAAKKLLEKNGFKLGSNGMLNMPNGKPFIVKITAPAPYTDWMTDTELMVSEMASAGITATVSGEAVSAWENDYAVGNYQLTFCGQFITNDPYSMYNYMLNSAFSAPIGKPASGDFERFNNSQADSALAAAAATDNRGKLLKSYATLESLMVNDVPIIPLFNGGSWAGYTTVHAVGWPTASNPYEMNAVESPWDEVVVLRLVPTK